MPKPNQGKTKTIKQRAIYVYLPSQRMADEWKEKADKAGVSVSKFVVEQVEDSLRNEEGEEGYRSRLELIQKLASTEEELKTLRQENRLLKKLVENFDRELKQYRTKPFLDEAFSGVRSFDKELITLLRSGGAYSGDDILSHLGISPSDVDLMKAVNQQLEALENYGLVEYVGRGWKWKP